VPSGTIETVLKELGDPQTVVFYNSIHIVDCISQGSPVQRIVGAVFNTVPPPGVLGNNHLKVPHIRLQFRNETLKVLSISFHRG
jgi:hypothetical protein